jgi:hypothetical protein
MGRRLDRHRAMHSIAGMPTAEVDQQGKSTPAIQRPKPIASATTAIRVLDFAVEDQVNQHVIALLAEIRRRL